LNKTHNPKITQHLSARRVGGMIIYERSTAQNGVGGRGARQVGTERNKFAAQASQTPIKNLYNLFSCR